MKLWLVDYMGGDYDSDYQWYMVIAGNEIEAKKIFRKEYKKNYGYRFDEEITDIHPITEVMGYEITVGKKVGEKL